MPTKDKIIHGQPFQISQPYAEGHTLTAVEAKVLNQVRSENIGNNMRGLVKEAVEKGTPEAITAVQAKITEYDNEYSFAIPGEGSARITDPYEKEGLALATKLIKESLAASGRKINVVPEGSTKEEWDAKVQAEKERIAALPEVVAAAKKNVDARKKQTESLAQTLNL